MSLTEDLQRLDQRRDAGGLTHQEYEGEKSRLLDAWVNRIEAWQQQPAARRIKPKVIRGSVRYLSFSDLKETATFWLDTQRVTVSGFGRPISMALGDRVLVVGTVKGESFQGLFYINESNGDNSVDRSRKMLRKLIAAGAAGILAAAAVVAAAAIVAFRGPALLSVGGLAKIAISLISTGAAVVLGWISFFLLCAGGFLDHLLRMIDREHHTFTD